MPQLGTKNAYWLLILPPLALVTCFYIFPVLQVLWISVTEPQPGLDNYKELFTNGAVQRMLWRTAKICLIVTVIGVITGYIVSYALVHVGAKHKRWMLFCVLLSFWMSILVRAFSWVVLLKPSGVVNTILLDVGLIDHPLELVRNELGVIIGMVHYMIPYAALPLYANMHGIDTRLVPAARGLGASPFGAFWRVFLPLSLPGVVGAGVLVFIFSLGFFVTPAILGGGKVTMISEYISIQILETLRWGLGSMLAGTALITVFLMFGLMSRFVRPREMFGAS